MADEKRDGKGKYQTNQHHNPTTNKKNNRTPTEHGKKKPNQRILLKISSIKKDELPLSESGGFQKNNNKRRGKTVTCTKGAGTLTEWTHEFIPNEGHNHKGKVEGQ